jgi:DNA-binding response OmpR family regulator
MAKILIAEDERDIRDLIVFTLTYGGHEVVAAPNGAELVELAPKEKPDLIISDVRMPKMTGYEACIALKANPATKDIPFVMLSAKGQEEEVRSGMDSGALDYILKPFAPDQLLNRIKDILAKVGSGKAAEAASKPAESKPDSKPQESKPPDSKAQASKAPETKPADTKPPDAKPIDAKPPDAKPSEGKPPERKP